jgi:hypothetical protein
MDKLYLAVFFLMEEPSLSAASKERSQEFLFGCKYTRWMRRRGLMTYCLAREDIDAGGRDAGWMKIERERRR